jgi:hypothetical protein
MNVQYLQTLTCSAIKFNEILRYYGKADIIPISFLSLLYKLLENPNMTVPFNCDRHLQQLAAKIQMENANICTPSVYVSSEVISAGNTAPTVNDSVISYDADSYAFQYADFTNGFDDVDGDSPETVRIVTLPVNGDLTWNGQPIVAGYEFDISEVHDLEFTRTNEDTTDLFTFQISDNNINKLFSNMASMTINIDQVINQPPDNVGVNAFTVESSGVKAFTLADFTYDTTPGYTDPDGDAPEAIMITSLPSNGVLSLNGTLIIINDVIPAADVVNLIYTSDPLDEAGYVEPFNFSVSDVGSHEFTAGGIITMTVEAYENQPPVIGDGERTVTEGVVIAFTRADFTDNTTPQYLDPEGDIADKLKIIVLPSAGELKLDGVTVLLNDIINFSDIDLSKLTYVQAASAGGTTPDFQYAIADAGSGIFST